VIEQRKSRRFELRLPLELLRTGSVKTQLSGETMNVSSVGVLFFLEADVSPGNAIEYLITLPTAPNADFVRIRCLGKVVRVDGAEVAATLERYEFIRAPKQSKAESASQDPRSGVRRKDGA
jgi:hypothetical protein